MGLMVMDEAFDEWRILKGKELGSNTHESRGYSEWFESCHDEDLRAMLLRDRNHPSIIIWSIGNEVPDQTVPEGYMTARHLKSICKELDPERAVTQANDQIFAEPHAATEEFLNELDVVGYNYVDRWRTRMETLYDDDRQAHPNWCMLGTENGGLGGVRGEYLLNMQERAGWWKQPYYSAPVVIGKLLHFTMTHDYIAGDFMWTGIDYLGEAHWPTHSASAGVLDTCGFEKDSFYFYKSIWKRTEPMVHLLPHWNLDVNKGSIIPVLGYTSCDSAELFLNGKSYGRKAYAYPAYGMTQKYGHFDKIPIPANTDDLFLSWDVPYEPGCIELVGYVDDREAARHVVRTAGAPAVVRLSSYRQDMKADGLDIAQIEAEILDDQGNLCVQADTELIFSIDGPACVIAVDNGNPEEMGSVKGNHIHAFHGRALAIIQSTDKTDLYDVNKNITSQNCSTQIGAGQCTVSVWAQDLTGDCIPITVVS
jgi:beta-galactosidase